MQMSWNVNPSQVSICGAQNGGVVAVLHKYPRDVIHQGPSFVLYKFYLERIFVSCSSQAENSQKPTIEVYSSHGMYYYHAAYTPASDR